MSASTRKRREELIGAAAIVARLADGPLAMSELPGQHEKRCAWVRRLRSEGVVDRLPNGKFVLTGDVDGLTIEHRPEEEYVADSVASSYAPRPVLAMSDVVTSEADRTDGKRWAVLSGDVRARLGGLPQECADLMPMSPPYYRYRDYGPGQLGDEDSKELYVENQIDVLRLSARALARQGTIWYVIEDKIINGRPLCIPQTIVTRAEEAGLFVVCDIIWAKESCLSGSSGRAPVLSHEHIIVFAKSMDYYWNGVMAREHGSRGAERNVRSVQYFSRRKEAWQKGHDAVFPPDLVRFAMRCGLSPHGRCRCGEPWEDVLTREVRTREQRKARVAATRKVVGVAPRCGHSGDPEPLLIVDPFCGTATSGMTSLADKSNVRFVGIENQDRFVQKSSENLSTISQEIDKRRVK